MSVIPMTGAVVAITGAARGIGWEIAKAFAAEGAQVALGDIDGDAALTAAGAISTCAPVRAHGFAVDVSNKSSFAQFLDAVEHRLGEVDILVNNAGVMWVGPFDREPSEALWRTMEVNFGGVVNGVQLVGPAFLARGRGHVITVASIAARLSPAGEASYAASKHAVYGYLKAVRAELEGSGVELSMVMPTVVATELAAGTSPGAVPALTAPQVAQAVLRVAHRPVFERTVPRWIAPLTTAVLALPERPRFAVLRALVPDQVRSAIPRLRKTYQDKRLGVNS